VIRVLHFADLVNHGDFIDTVVRYADPARFAMSLCVRTPRSNIQAPEWLLQGKAIVLGGTSRARVPQATLQLAGLLRKHRIDLLHTHHFDQALIGAMAVRLAGRTRLVIGRHYSDSLYRIPPGPKRNALLRLEHWANAGARAIVAPSLMIEELLLRQGVPGSRIFRVPYPVTPDRYCLPDDDELGRLRTAEGIEGFAIGTFARLHEEKGHRHLLEAAAALMDGLPKLHFYLVGDGPERVGLADQINRLGLTHRVRALGWRQDGLSLMAAMDAVVQPTLQEAFSSAMVEAMWLGKPLVMSDVSGARDLIEHRRTGWIVPPGDPVALAAAIRELAHDPDAARAVGRLASRHVRDHLRLERIIPMYERVYESASA